MDAWTAERLIELLQSVDPATPIAVEVDQQWGPMDGYEWWQGHLVLK